MKWFNKYYIAHRGLHNNIDIIENTVLSFEKAILLDYAIELDVTISKDALVIVFHDDDFNRLCFKDKKVEEVNSSYIRKLNLLNSNEKIPTLQKVLTQINSRVPLIIELKKHKSIGLLESKVVELLDNYKGDFVLCSFDKNIVKWFKKNHPNFYVGLIVEKCYEKFDYINFLYKYKFCKADFISLDYRFIYKSIWKFCKKNNIVTLSCTINSTENLEIIKDKVDGIIFENIIP